MKYISLFFLLFFIFSKSLSAFCFSEEIEAQCSITGETFRSSCEGWSDTSFWNIPIAYEGECLNTFTLSENLRNQIFQKVDSFFIQQKLYDNSPYNRLNRDGQEFIMRGYFPAIQKIIQEEKQKEKPDMKKIAVFNYAAFIIQYDFEVKQ